MYYLDTNIFVRALTGDDEKKMKHCQDLFQKIAQKKVIATTSETVIAEVVYVLSSKVLNYGFSRKEIRDQLETLLMLNGFRFSQKEMVIQALYLYAEKNIDFSDALLAQYAINSEANGVYSYNTDFDKIPSVKRKVP
ncbi:type II toxin-antitoxin system VapC family toxin [Candidatus Roizmanbacteria bacterium]|nr:type II toxin-antitoxin system VapC family toxin [Candidatus Roizmanbacteria bacterium]